MMKTNKAPCLNCTERAIGCHAVCEKYAAYRKECDKVLDARKRAHDANGDHLVATRRNRGLGRWKKA